MKMKIGNYVNRITCFNANLIYFICIFLALGITIVVYPYSNLENIIEIAGTFIQIALPCYVIVPVLSKKDWAGARQMLWYLFLVLSLTYILKYVVHSKRPYGGSMSFPSGHTAGAFIGAIFLSFRYGRKHALITIPFATFVAFSRVYSRNHWLTDVAASIVICLVIGMFLVRKHTKKDLQKQN